MLILRTCNLATIACGRCSLVTNKGEVVQLYSWPFKLSPLYLNNKNSGSCAATNLLFLTIALSKSNHRHNSKVSLTDIFPNPSYIGRENVVSLPGSLGMLTRSQMSRNGCPHLPGQFNTFPQCAPLIYWQVLSSVISYRLEHHISLSFCYRYLDGALGGAYSYFPRMMAMSNKVRNC